MSFILDALNKSERERRRASAPSLETPVAHASPARRSGFVSGLAAGAVVAVMAGAGWWFWSGPGEPAIPSEPLQTGTRQRSRPEPPGPRAEPVPSPATAAQSAPATGDAGVPEIVPAPDATRPDPAPRGLSLNVLSYSSDPAKRFVMINLRNYGEGDRLPDGSRILEIRSGSVLLEHDGRELELRP
ncbi:MAG: general secretion pathway protein GspB [Gammaproteobacteria bacterium]|jgi:general secretion pathway protein B|nr:general secretion pathway protein GspB [Gammaproteobacteria bacterium]